jgi:hypothetical protein
VPDIFQSPTNLSKNHGVKKSWRQKIMASKNHGVKKLRRQKITASKNDGVKK